MNDSMLSRADLVLVKDGKVVVVVEAKGRPLSSDFRAPVIQQLEHYARATNAGWAILADPKTIRVYRGDSFGQPSATVQTADLQSNGQEPVGEQTLLLALERWLRTLPNSELLKKHPELKSLAESVAGTSEYLTEFLVA